MEIVNVEDRNRFEARLPEGTGLLTYRLDPGTIVFLHTEVPEELEGRGVGGALAKTGLEHARTAGLRVVPVCPFVKAYLKRHREYQDLVAEAAGKTG